VSEHLDRAHKYFEEGMVRTCVCAIFVSIHDGPRHIGKFAMHDPIMHSLRVAFSGHMYYIYVYVF